MAEYSVMDRINMIISDPDHATMTLAQIVTEEIREFKASEQYANMIQAEAYYRNRTDVQRKTNDVANRSNTRIEHPILKKLVDQKANYLLGKPFTVDTKNSSYGDALNDVFDQTFRRKIKSLGKGAVKSGIAWLHSALLRRRRETGLHANPVRGTGPDLARRRANEAGRLHSLL